MTQADALRVRRLLFIVVDAGQSPSGDLNRTVDGPSGIDMAGAAIDAAMATNVRTSYDAFVPMMKEWRDSLVAYRCGLPHARKLELSSTRPGWRCDDVQFSVTRISFDALGKDRAAGLNALPTRLRLPEQDVDRLIEPGRDAVVRNAAVRQFARNLKANGG